jgi:hypothetical protein
MAAPVITSIDRLYPDGQDYITPGQTAEIVVHATDPDNQTIRVDVTVSDSSGAPTSETVLIVQSDPLTFAATSDSATVTQDPTAPGRFYVSNPQS